MKILEELQFLTNGIYVLTVRQGEVRHGMSSRNRQDREAPSSAEQAAAEEG